MSLNSAMFSFSVRSTGRKIRPRETVRMPPYGSSSMMPTTFNCCALRTTEKP